MDFSPDDTIMTFTEELFIDNTKYELYFIASCNDGDNKIDCSVNYFLEGIWQCSKIQPNNKHRSLDEIVDALKDNVFNHITQVNKPVKEETTTIITLADEYGRAVKKAFVNDDNVMM